MLAGNQQYNAKMFFLVPLNIQDGQQAAVAAAAPHLLQERLQLLHFHAAHIRRNSCQTFRQLRCRLAGLLELLLPVLLL
jgi:hypothetical protein